MVLVIVALWIVAALLIDPRGEFPLNDDWAYAAAVKTLLGGGGIRLSGWTTVNLIAQIFWGALFCLPFGFSFTALRISTLVLGLTGVLGLYGLLREGDAGHGTALFGALLLAFNPLYLVLSYTFMSDVPFLAVSLLSFYFLVRGMRKDSGVEIVAGLLLACGALLIRQTGLAIFMGFSVAYVAKYGWRRQKVLLAVVSLASGFAVQILWHHYLVSRHILPALYGVQSTLVLSPRSYVSWDAAKPFLAGLVILCVYLGLFLFPLILWMGPRKVKALCRPRLVNWMTAAYAVVGAIVLRRMRMPILRNTLYDLGLGPALLQGGSPSLPTAGKGFWAVVTLAGFLGSVVLVGATLLAIGKTRKFLPMPEGKRELLVILLASGLIYLVPLSVLTFTGRGFDRYVLFLVPLGIVILFLLARDAGRAQTGSLAVNINISLAVACLILYGAFSIAGTHDYLSWNRARWQALNNLETEQRVGPGEIDGGFEFNALYLYDPGYKARPGKSWYFVARDDFMIAFEPVPGFTEMKRYPFQRWLPPGDGNILVLRRTQANSGEAR
jgi:4-amino-4-deoxy-L-arabinose transferase-like glycosyltransferase